MTVSSPVVTLTEEQSAACDSIVSWFHSGGSTYRLGGLAGCGKTTLTAAISERLETDGIAYCAYTGKASSVLRKKLSAANITTTQWEDAEFDDNRGTWKDGKEFDSVSTIHGLIYMPYEIDVGTGKLDEHGKEIMEQDIRFSKREREDFPGWVKMIIVDEASMIDEYTWNDLMSYGVPIIAIGDHFQLPPVRSSGFSLMKNLDWRLEKIHRQAEASPIIQVARWAREQQFVPVGFWTPTIGKISVNSPEAAVDLAVQSTAGADMKSTLLLVRFNKTRVELNSRMRKSLGFKGKTPVPGDRVVCRRNNWPMGIFNGLTGTVREVHPIPKERTLGLVVDTDNGTVYHGQAVPRYFNSEQYKGNKDDPKGDVWDFGYALTVHNAQGSQAHRVVVVEESARWIGREEHARWLYTGVTRATDELLIIE